MKSVTQFCPQLVQGTWHSQGEWEVFISENWERAHRFSASEAWWAKRFSGDRSLQNLCREALAQDAEHSSFALLPLLQNLSDKDLLVQKLYSGSAGAAWATRSLHALIRVWKSRQWTLLRGKRSLTTTEILLPLGSSIVVGVFGLAVVQVLRLDGSESLFLYRGGVAPGIAFFFFFLSLLGSLCGLSSWYIQKYCSGVEEKLCISLDIFGIRVDCPRQTSFAFLPRPKAILQALVLLGQIPFLALILALFVSDSSLRFQMCLYGLFFLTFQARPAWAFRWIREEHQRLWGVVWGAVALALLFVALENLANLWLRSSSMSLVDQMCAVFWTVVTSGLFLSGCVSFLRIHFVQAIFKSMWAEFVERLFKRKWIPESTSALMAEMRKTQRFFREVSDSGFETLLIHGGIFRYPRGCRPFRQNQNDDRVFILIQGEVDVVQRDSTDREATVVRLAAPSMVGEIAGLQSGERASSLVVTSKEAVVWQIPQTALLLMRAASDSQDADRIRQELQYSKILSACPVWSALPPEVMDRCLLAGNGQTIATGDEVPFRGFAQTLRGIFRWEGPDGTAVTLEAGDVWASENLVLGDAPVGKIICLEPGVLFQMDSRQFWNWAGQGPLFWIPIELFNDSLTVMRCKTG